MTRGSRQLYMARALAVQNITIITYTKHKTRKLTLKHKNLSARMKMYLHVVPIQSLKNDKSFGSGFNKVSGSGSGSRRAKSHTKIEKS
jgi:hypothetical protein